MAANAVNGTLTNLRTLQMEIITLPVDEVEEASGDQSETEGSGDQSSNTGSGDLDATDGDGEESVEDGPERTSNPPKSTKPPSAAVRRGADISSHLMLIACVIQIYVDS